MAVPDMGVEWLSVALRALYGDIPRTAIFGNGCVTQSVETTPDAVTPKLDQACDQRKRNLQKKILDITGL